MIADFHFLRPLWLTLIPIIVLVWWRSRRVNDPLWDWRSVMDPELLNALTIDADKKTTKGYGQLIVWILAALAVAGPTWRLAPSPFADDPNPVMIALKASKSMDTDDFSPSRMERARLKVIDFANERPGKPLGLVAYAGTAHLVLPPSRDTAVVAEMAAEISPSIMPVAGDDLAKALITALRSFGDQTGTVLVVADKISPENQSALNEFRRSSGLRVEILAVARPDSPELQSIRHAASNDAGVTVMTPDQTDIETLITRTALHSTPTDTNEDESRWAEAGWWLTPVIALYVLTMFRRQVPETLENTA